MAETLDAAADVGALFAPFAIKGLNLPNRIVMAPMTRSKSPGGVPGPDVAAYYRRRAEGEIGLIITEGTAPDHRDVARNDPDVPRFFGADALAGWSFGTSACCAAQTRCGTRKSRPRARPGCTSPASPRPIR